MSDEQPCNTCGADNSVPWFTDSPFWNDVTQCNGDGGPFLCLACFDKLVQQRGYPVTGWHVIPELRGQAYQSQVEKLRADLDKAGPRVTAIVTGREGMHEAVLEWRQHSTCREPGWCYADNPDICVHDRDIVTMRPLIGGQP